MVGVPATLHSAARCCKIAGGIVRLRARGWEGVSVQWLLQQAKGPTAFCTASCVGLAAYNRPTSTRMPIPHMDPPPLRRRSALHCGHGSGSGELSRGAAYPVVNPLLKLASRQRAASGAAAQQAQQAPHITPPVWQEQPGAGSSGGGGVGGGGARSPGAHHPPAH